jgi:hypothetical protein
MIIDNENLICIGYLNYCSLGYGIVYLFVDTDVSKEAATLCQSTESEYEALRS